MNNEFWNEKHEDLYRMFVAEFIGWQASEYILNVFEMEFSFANRLLDLFPKEVCGEEFEGYVSEDFIRNCKSHYDDMYGRVDAVSDNEYRKILIKFRFED